MDDASRAIVGEAAVNAVLEPPRRGRLFSRKRKTGEPLTQCENCGAALTGAYCAQCGQHAVDYRRSIWRVLVDAADSFLNWDTKFLTTIGVLLARPWKLTNDFNAGRRARYVHPLRLYLLASIAFFLLARLINFHPGRVLQFDDKDRARFEASLADLAADPSLTDEQHAKIEKARANLAQATGTKSAEDRKRLEEAMATLVTASVAERRNPKDQAEFDAALNQAAQERMGNAEATSAATPEQPRPSPSPSATPATRVKPGHLQRFANPEQKNEFENWMESRIKDKIGEGGTKSKLFLDTLRSNIPTMMLCCIPLFALVLKVLYLRKRRFYVEHLIYALHIHTFVYVAVVVITLLAMASARWLPGARGLVIAILTTATGVQVFLSIRRVYRQGWFFSTFKFLLGGIVYFVILILAVGATAFITLLLPA